MVKRTVMGIGVGALVGGPVGAIVGGVVGNIFEPPSHREVSVKEHTRKIKIR